MCMVVWPGWGITLKSGLEVTSGHYALKSTAYHGSHTGSHLLCCPLSLSICAAITKDNNFCAQMFLSKILATICSTQFQVKFVQN